MSLIHSIHVEWIIEYVWLSLGSMYLMMVSSEPILDFIKRLVWQLSRNEYLIIASEIIELIILEVFTKLSRSLVHCIKHLITLEVGLVHNHCLLLPLVHFLQSWFYFLALVQLLLVFFREGIIGLNDLCWRVFFFQLLD